MPLATGIPDRRNGYGPIDTLLAIAQGTYSATQTSSAMPLAATNYTFDFYAQGTYTGYSAGSAEWTARLLVSTDGSTFTSVGASFVMLTGKLQHVRLDGETIRAAIKDSAAKITHVKLELTKTGSPGNITGWASLARV